MNNEHSNPDATGSGVDSPKLTYEMAESFEQERAEFLEWSMINAARAYGDDEPEYTDADLIERNPNYQPRS